MAEYIEREALLKAISKSGGSPLSEWDTVGVVSLVANQPAADVAPVIRGQWKRSKDSYCFFRCSVCNEAPGFMPGVPSYCPWCGAKMNGEWIWEN